MPRAQIKRLETELSDALRKSCHDIAIAAALRNFFVDSIGAYRKFIHFPAKPGEPALDVPKDAIPSGRLWFDHAAFVASTRSHSTQAFLTTLRHTQCFEAFITSRMDAIGNGGGLLADDAFERAVAEAPDLSDKMNKVADKAAAAGAVAARVAKQKAAGAWGSILRFGESAASTIESAIERAEKSQAAQHIRQRSFDNLPGLGGLRGDAPPQSPLGRGRDSTSSVPGSSAGGLDKEAPNSKSVPTLRKDASQDSCSNSDVDIAKRAAEANAETVTIKSSPVTSARNSLDVAGGGAGAAWPAAAQPAISPPRSRPGSEGLPLPPMMRPSKLLSPLLASTSPPPPPTEQIDLLSLDGSSPPPAAPAAAAALSPFAASPPAPAFNSSFAVSPPQPQPPAASPPAAARSSPPSLTGLPPNGAASAAPEPDPYGFDFGGPAADSSAASHGGFSPGLASVSEAGSKAFELDSLAGGAAGEQARPQANGSAMAPEASAGTRGEVDFWDTVPSPALQGGAQQWGAAANGGQHGTPGVGAGEDAAGAQQGAFGGTPGAKGADPWGSLGAMPPPPPTQPVQPTTDLLSW